MKKLFLTVQALLLLVLYGFSSVPQIVADHAETPFSVPVTGNYYLTAGPSVGNPLSIGDEFYLQSPESKVDMYFYLGEAGVLNLGLKGNAGGEGKTSVLNVSVNGGVSYEIAMNGAQTRFYPVGKFDIPASGYVRVSFQGAGKVSELMIGGTATTGENCYFNESNENVSQHFARRGPSVHFRYNLPRGDEYEYFYNELTVTPGNDVVGTYCMTNGFGEGYCGLQVNSKGERRILFSVWSPFETDYPNQIPPDQEVVNIRRGEGVRVNAFGGEGSGGQSYLIYPWKAGETYKILTQVKYYGPSEYPSYPYLNEYTAYFFDPERDEWRLIAAWRRPDKQKKTYTGAHSFLENFIPGQGYITREACYGNQWARTVGGKWVELTTAHFTYDYTAIKKVRADYYGGMTDNRFVLRNCGFFDDNTVYNTEFRRKPNRKRPKIDLEALKRLPSVE